MSKEKGPFTLAELKDKQGATNWARLIREEKVPQDDKKPSQKVRR